MSNSNHDNNEFQYLEARLRQTKPPTDPMSPALKRRLLADLTETNSMKTTFWPLQSLGNAVVALFLLIGLPLLFWGVLVSLNTQAATGPGDAAPTPPSEGALDELAPPTAIPGAADLEPVTPAAYNLAVTATPIPTATPAVFDPQYPMINSPDARVVARIIEIGDPVLSEEHAIGDSTPYLLPITVETTLIGYEEASLIVGMTTVTRAETAGSDDEASSDLGTLTMAGESQSQITAGTNTQLVTFLLSETQLTEELALSPDISFHLKVLYEDENTGQPITLDAAGVRPSAETEAVLPVPEWTSLARFQVISISDKGAPDARTINVTVAHAPAKEEGELDLRVATLGGDILAEETHPISAESALTSLHIQLPTEQLDAVYELVFDATVRVNGSEQSLSQIVPAYATEGVAADQIELESAQVDPIGDALRFTLLLRYHLTDAHESGIISHRSRFESSSGGGGGGGGGSRIEVPAGQGLAMVSFDLSGPGLTADNWHDLVTIELGLLAEDGGETSSLHTLQPDIVPTATPMP